MGHLSQYTHECNYKINGNTIWRQNLDGRSSNAKGTRGNPSIEETLRGLGREEQDSIKQLIAENSDLFVSGRIKHKGNYLTTNVSMGSTNVENNDNPFDF